MRLHITERKESTENRPTTYASCGDRHRQRKLSYGNKCDELVPANGKQAFRRKPRPITKIRRAYIIVELNSFCCASCFILMMYARNFSSVRPSKVVTVKVFFP